MYTTWQTMHKQSQKKTNKMKKIFATHVGAKRYFSW